MINFEQELQVFSEEIESFMREKREQGRTLFNKSIKNLIIDSSIQAMVWVQYTPFFNDGDTCEFGVGEPFIIFDGFDPNDIKSVYEYEDLSDGDNPSALWSFHAASSYHQERLKPLYEKYNVSKETLAHFNSLAKFMQTNSDIMQQLFGDHAQVAVYMSDNNTIEVVVSEYDHE